jgi:hypothetical protein
LNVGFWAQSGHGDGIAFWSLLTQTGHTKWLQTLIVPPT